MSPSGVAWSSTVPAVATVDATGTVVGLSPGTTDVVAAAAGKEAHATITIAPAPVSAVSLSATTVALVKGAAQQLTATTRDAGGVTLAGRVVTWSSSDSLTARVSQTGLVTAVAVGTAVVTATSEGKAASATITISAAPIANIDRTSSYAIAQTNALASLIDWATIPDYGKTLTARAVADLDNDGVADAVVAVYTYPSATPTDPVRFFKGTAASGAISLSDRTTTWVKGAPASVVHPRKVILGDFNGDGIKDVYVCAHGWDFAPFPGTTNALLLSSGLGSWSVSTQAWSSYVGFHHGCASADVDNDGDEDILVLDSKTTSYFLLNDGHGAFTQSRTGLPASINRKTPVYTTELFDLDRDGFIDMLVAGDERYQPTAVFWGDGSGTFSDARMTTIPAVTGWQHALIFSTADVDGDGKLELAIGRTKDSDAEFYQGYRVQMLRVSGRTFTDATATLTAATNSSAPTVVLDYTGVPTWLEWFWLADYDHDGHPDLVASDAFKGRFLSRNVGGSFGPWVKLP